MKRNAFFPFAFAAVAALVAAPVLGEDSDAVDMRVLRRGHIVVRGSIGPIDKLTFLIDTGASVTTVDRLLADRMRLDTRPVEATSLFGSDGRFPEAVLKDVAFGPVRVESVEAVVLDHSRLILGRHVDVVVGLDILGRFDFTIDHRAGKLRFQPRDPFERRAALLGIAPLLLVESPGLEALGLDGILALRSLKHSQVHFDFQSRLLSWRE